MKNYRFAVTFTTGKYEIIYTSDFESAIILSMAEQIKKRNDFRILKVVNTETDVTLDYPKVIFTA